MIRSVLTLHPQIPHPGERGKEVISWASHGSLNLSSFPSGPSLHWAFYPSFSKPAFPCSTTLSCLVCPGMAGQVVEIWKGDRGVQNLEEMTLVSRNHQKFLKMTDITRNHAMPSTKWHFEVYFSPATSLSGSRKKELPVGSASP